MAVDAADMPGRDSPIGRGPRGLRAPIPHYRVGARVLLGLVRTSRLPVSFGSVPFPRGFEALGGGLPMDKTHQLRGFHSSRSRPKIRVS